MLEENIWKGIDWINGFWYLCCNKLTEWRSWICSWAYSCLEVAAFESHVAELKQCVPDLEIYTSEQLQTHAVTAAWVNQSKSLLLHRVGWLISCYGYIWSWMIDIRFIGLTILGGWNWRHALLWQYLFAIITQYELSESRNTTAGTVHPSETKFSVRNLSVKSVAYSEVERPWITFITIRWLLY